MECNQKLGTWSARFGDNNTLFCKKCFSSEEIVQKHVDLNKVNSTDLQDIADSSFKNSETINRLIQEKRRLEAEKKQKEKENWFYSTNLQEKKGPITYNELTSLFKNGYVKEDTVVWSPNLDDWLPINKAFEVMKSKEIAEDIRIVDSDEVLAEDFQNTEKSFFSLLASGHFGLAKTYWLYGVLVGGIASVLSNFITSITGLIIFMVVYIAYEIPVLMGVWQASSKYTGASVWAVLAKIAVVLGAVMLTITLLSLLALLSNS